MLPSAKPLTLSTKPTTRAESSAARGPSGGARKRCSNGSKSRWNPSPLKTEKRNASSGTIASIVV